jgi:DNA-binding XRE family transcriptional regulator
MGALAKQVQQIDSVKSVIARALAHLDSLGLKKDQIEKVASAADLAFSDRLLFEKFELWDEEQDDEALLFHIGRYFEKKDQAPLPREQRDQTRRREAVEHQIKEKVREQQKRIFSERLTQLAIEKSLLTNEQLGKFLGVSTEQARKYKSGEYKPQLATLKPIADKFGVLVGFLVGLESK